MPSKDTLQKGMTGGLGWLALVEDTPVARGAPFEGRPASTGLSQTSHPTYHKPIKATSWTALQAGTECTAEFLISPNKGILTNIPKPLRVLNQKKSWQLHSVTDTTGIASNTTTTGVTD